MIIFAIALATGFGMYALWARGQDYRQPNRLWANLMCRLGRHHRDQDYRNEWYCFRSDYCRGRRHGV